MPFSDYYQLDWTLGPSVLVIGGETTGLGKTVKKLSHENKGHIVHVPMVSKLDSLSAAMAGTVIIHQAYRQVITATQAKRWHQKINNEWSPIQSVIIQVIKINRTTT